MFSTSLRLPLFLLGLYLRNPALAVRHVGTAVRLLTNGGTAELRGRLRRLGGAVAQHEREERESRRRLASITDNARINCRALLADLAPFAQDLTVLDVIYDDHERLRLIHCHILRKFSLFDDGFYSETNLKDVAGITPIDHYLKYGLPGGLRANPFFDPVFYVANYPAVAEQGFDPLVHYALFGWRDGRKCGSLFDADHYLAANADVAVSGISPLSHFLATGRSEGRAPTAGAAGLTHDRGTILLVSHDAEVGGAQQVARVFAQWLVASTKFDVKIVVVKGGPLMNQFRRIAGTFDLTAQSVGASPQEVARRLEDFAGSDVKAVLLNSAASGGFLEHWRRDTPVVAFVHELPKLLGILHYEFELIRERAQTIIGGSEAVTKALADELGVEADRLRTVYAFIGATSLDDFVDFESKRAAKTALGFDPDDFLVAGCGVIHWRKSPEKFVEVAERVVASAGASVRFVWIGGGPDQDKCERLVAAKRLADRIAFTGYEPDIMRYLKAADLFLLTSQEDPFPLVCLNAAMALAPVVCFEKAGGMPEFVARGCGRSVPFMDVDAMAEAVLVYLGNEALRRAEGMAGRALVEAEFTVAATGPQLLHHIRQAAGLKPHVSVVVPNYNYEAYLPERLDTILGQTFQDFELVLLDDRSSDGSVALLERYATRRPGSRVVVNEQNSGSPSAQWLLGMEIASAGLVWLAEADDACEPQLLAALLQCLEDRNVFLAHAKSVPVGPKGEVYAADYQASYLDRITWGRWAKPHVATDHEEAEAGLGIANCIPNASAVVFRRFEPERDFVDIVRSMRLCGDWLFYLRAMRGGMVAYCDRPLNLHRRHGETVTHSTEGTRRYFDEFAAVRAHVGAQYRLSAEALAAIARFTEEDLDRFGVIDEAERARVLEQAAMLGGEKAMPAVLVVVSDLSPGGGQLFGIRLANAWTRRGGRAVLLNAGHFPDHPKVVAKINPRVALFDARTMPCGFAELVRRFDVDIVHSSIWWADRYVEDNIGELQDLPWVVTMHGCHETILNNPAVDLSFPDRVRRMLGRVDAWVTTARKNRRVFERYGQAAREEAIRNGVEIETGAPLSRRQLGLKPGSNVLCLASRAIPEKGWFAAVEMVERLNAAGRETELMLIGEGPAADAIAAQSPPHVRLYGQVDNLQDYIAAADIGILPTSFVGESMPLVLLEFMAHGKPVIATDMGEIPEMLGEGDAAGGVVVPLKGGKVDVDGFVAAVTRLWDASTRAALGQRAKRRFDEHYTIEEMVEEYSALYATFPRDRSNDLVPPFQGDE